MPGSKHLIQCHCILPQYRKLEIPIFHKFIVFSTTDKSGDVIPKIAKCNNCGVAHKIVDFCKSEVISAVEDSISVISIDDLRNTLPEKICAILDKHKCDTATWEQTSDIFENNLWESSINLSSQKISGMTQIKSLTISGINEYKIEVNIRQDDIARDK